MSEHEDKSTSEQRAATPGLSAVLVAAREQMGLSQKNVADRLFLKTAYVRYMDDDDFDRFPAPAFIRGYLRLYARLVGLPGDEIVKLYEAELQAKAPVPETKEMTEEKIGGSSITGPIFQTGLIGLVALVVVLSLVWWLVSEADPLPQVTQPALREPAAPAQPQQDEPQPVIETEHPAEDPDDNAPAEAVDDEPETADDEVAATDDEDALIKLERTFEDGVTHIFADAGGMDEIRLTFFDECWVEIEDARQERIYNDLHVVNEVLTVQGTAPFEVLLGRATGVEILYNGRPFEFDSHINQDETAKITVSD